MKKLLFTFFLLSACGALTTKSLHALDDLDPVGIDPAHLTVALDIPQELAPAPDMAWLYFGGHRTDTGEKSDGAYALEITKAATSNLENVGLYLTLSTADVAKFRRQQQKLGQWKSQAPDATKGYLSVRLNSCFAQTAPDPQATYSLYMRFDPNQAFVPVVSDARIADIQQAATAAGPDHCKP